MERAASALAERRDPTDDAKHGQRYRQAAEVDDPERTREYDLQYELKDLADGLTNQSDARAAGDARTPARRRQHVHR